MTPYAERIARAQRALRDRNLAGAVFAPTDHMRYLTGWASAGHERFLALLLPADGEPVFIVPAMNAPQAAGNPAGIGAVRGWEDAAGWQRAAQSVLGAWQIQNSAGIAVDDELQSRHLLALQAILPGAPCVTAGSVMQALREVKSDDEIARLAHSAAVTDDVFKRCLPHIREGMSERDLREIIRGLYVEHGTEPAFAIIGFGPNSAMPHHDTGDSRLQRGDVIIIDIGCVYDGYYSDITRTIAFGEPPEEARRVYRIVLAAYRAAYVAVRPGVTAEAVDAAARGVIAQSGYGDRFIHRTGHGIGLSGHEDPNIVQGNSRPLGVGMCFSDEPGIYLPGRFGVRIENILTVTTAGAHSLNEAPPEELPALGDR